MTPRLLEGPQLTVNKFERHVPGDIVVFEGSQGELLVHRYLGPVPGGRVMTKADARKMIDAIAHGAKMIGRVDATDGAHTRAGIKERVCAMLNYFGGLVRLLAWRASSSRA